LRIPALQSAICTFFPYSRRQPSGRHGVIARGEVEEERWCAPPRFRPDTHEEKLVVVGQRALIEQVIINLATNATPGPKSSSS
jgi:hypothetical protein